MAYVLRCSRPSPNYREHDGSPLAPTVEEAIPELDDAKAFANTYSLSYATVVVENEIDVTIYRLEDGEVFYDLYVDS